MQCPQYQHENPDGCKFCNQYGTPLSSHCAECSFVAVPGRPRCLPGGNPFFQHALALARRQEAKSWERRAAPSLVRLWQAQGKRQEATDPLAPVYEWFTEGFDTSDLKESKGCFMS